MKKSTLEAAALIVGSAGSIVTMIFHPTGHDLLTTSDATFRYYEWLAMATHSLGLVSYPLLFFGFLGLYRRLGREGALNTASLTAYGMAGVTVICAAIFSGLVGPELFSLMTSAGDDASRTVWESLTTYNRLLNRGFAWVYIVASSLAVLGWSTAMLHGRADDRDEEGDIGRSGDPEDRDEEPAGDGEDSAAGGWWLGWFGCLVGLGALLAFFGGYLQTDVHSFGLFVFCQAAWSTAVGISWLRE